MLSQHAIEVTREAVGASKFPPDPVQLSSEHRRQLDRKLERAMLLGNGEHVKCRILFKDGEGLKQVHTTVWSFDKGSIVLKAGVTIPMHRVLDIDMP